ncbi:MAG: hypothetical protein LWW95_08535 [Candidatus Desulfofervidus auxilii]|nr:hypothetical protein [Candidatus Desulfofervidus auxilii]
MEKFTDILIKKDKWQIKIFQSAFGILRGITNRKVKQNEIITGRLIEVDFLGENISRLNKRYYCALLNLLFVYWSFYRPTHIYFETGPIKPRFKRTIYNLSSFFISMIALKDAEN